MIPVSLYLSFRRMGMTALESFCAASWMMTIPRPGPSDRDFLFRSIRGMSESRIRDIFPH